jgi:hypothetical protein
MEEPVYEVSPRGMLTENGSEMLPYMLKLIHLNVHT